MTKVIRAKHIEKRQFYLDILYIYRNWSPRMKDAFGVSKKHVKEVLKKYEKYK